MSDLITRAETAKILGITPRRVSDYANKGLLQRFKQGRCTFYRREAVLNVMQLKPRTRAYRREINNDLINLEKRVSMLEAELVSLQMGLGISRTRRTITEQDAKAALNSAHRFLHQATVTVEDAGEWIAFFHELNEDILRTICSVNQDPNAWKVFVRVGAKVQREVQGTDPLSLALSRKLEEGIRNLRAAAFFAKEWESEITK